MIFEQAGSTLTVFADEVTNLAVTANFAARFLVAVAESAVRGDLRAGVLGDAVAPG